MLFEYIELIIMADLVVLAIALSWSWRALLNSAIVLMGACALALLAGANAFAEQLGNIAFYLFACTISVLLLAPFVRWLRLMRRTSVMGLVNHARRLRRERI